MPATSARLDADPKSLVAELDRAIQTGPEDLSAWLDATDEAREDAACHLLREGDRDGYFDLRLRESVALQIAGRPEQAFGAAHEVWVGVDGRAPYTACALVLTQLAACARDRGDIRAALRAARRAEALIVADSGDDLPQVLAIRAWLLRILESRGSDITAVRDRLNRTLAGLTRAAKDPAAQARLDRMRRSFIESTDPPHWAFVHFRRWKI
ncbi:MAG: hypothetical protein CMJ83_20830 [Planctomycetes bacterium]|nr:hypothetical protein [Planctomycetota bacterium]